MLACIYNEEGKMELVEKERPQAKADTAVMRVLATSICGTDFRTYLYGSQKISPGTTLGHEMCGEIVEIGALVKGFSTGDIVTVTPAPVSYTHLFTVRGCSGRGRGGQGGGRRSDRDTAGPGPGRQIVHHPHGGCGGSRGGGESGNRRAAGTRPHIR